MRRASRLKHGLSITEVYSNGSIDFSGCRRFSALATVLRRRASRFIGAKGRKSCSDSRRSNPYWFPAFLAAGHGAAASRGRTSTVWAGIEGSTARGARRRVREVGYNEREFTAQREEQPRNVMVAQRVGGCVWAL